MIHLPTLNASLNGLAGVFLFLGWIAIKRGKKQDLHRTLMLCAFASSALFLISYLYYHITNPGVTRYPHGGMLKVFYLSTLITHSILAAIVPPASIVALVYAFKGDYVKHVKVTRWLYPMWAYVSVTGVVVYLMLYKF